MARRADIAIRYILDAVDRGVGEAIRKDQMVRKSVIQTDAAIAASARKATVSATKVTQATAREAAAWRQVGIAANQSEKAVAQASIRSSAHVSRATTKQVAALRKQGLTYSQIAKQQRAAGVSAGATAAAIERASAREVAALTRTQRARDRARAAMARTASTARAYGGFAAALGLGAIVNETVKFDRAMRNVNSIAQQSERDFARMSNAVRQLAGKTAQAPDVLAEGLYDLVSSGFKAGDAMTVLEASARAATAGLTTTDVSAKAVAAVINAYGLEAKDAARVSDVLFRTVDRGVINFETLSHEIGTVLPMATNLDVSLEQVGAAIATMTKQGVPAAESFTYLRGTMTALSKPSEDMAGAFRELGVKSGTELIEKTGSLQAALDALRGTTDGSTESMSKLFRDVRARSGALALTGDKAKGAARDLKGLENAGGATSRALAQQSRSISYQWNKLKAEAKSVAIAVGTDLIRAIRSPEFRGFANTVKSIAKPMLDVSVAVAKFTAKTPGLKHAAAAAIALGVGFKAVKFAGAVTGITDVITKLRALRKVKAGEEVADNVVGPLGGRLRARISRVLGAARGGIRRIMGSLGRSGGSAAAATMATTIETGGAGAGAATGWGMNSRKNRGRFGRFGRGFGKALGAGILAGLLLALPDIVEAVKKKLVEKLPSLERYSGSKGWGNLVDDLNPFNRRGGRIRRRFRAGGRVPIVASGGEVYVAPDGSAMRVPGPANRDATPMLAHDGGAILTGHGQALMASGASLDQAIAAQRPHFRAGGVVEGRYSATSYGPPWNAMQGTGVTKRGTDLRPARKRYIIAVDPSFIPLGSRVKAWPNPFGRRSIRFLADDIGGAIDGREIDFYDWRGRRAQNRWGRKSVRVTRASGGGANPGEGGASRIRPISDRLSFPELRRIQRPNVEGAFRSGYDVGIAGGRAGALATDDAILPGALEAARIARPEREQLEAGARPTGGGGTPAQANRGVKAIVDKWNVNRAVASIGYAANRRFGVGIISGKRRAGALTATGGVSNHGDGAALDLGTVYGQRNLRIGRWVRKHFSKGIRNVTEGVFDLKNDPNPPDHANHVHVAARGSRAIRKALYPFRLGMRRGGFIGRFRDGGRIDRLTSTQLLPHIARAGRGDPTNRNVTRALKELDERLGRMTVARLEGFRRTILRQITTLRRGGLTGHERNMVQRLRSALSLLDFEVGRRVGVIVRGVEKAIEATAGWQTSVDLMQRAAGIDPSSAYGMTQQAGVNAGIIGALGAQVPRLQEAIRRAQGAGDTETVTELQTKLKELQGTIAEAAVRQIELWRDSVRAAAQESVDLQQHRSSMLGLGLQRLELQQRLGGTFETGGAERAAFIRNQIIPQLMGEVAALQQQMMVASQTGDQSLARQIAEAIWAKENEVLQAQLDANEATQAATEDAADALRNFGGTLGFEFGGERLTDQLIGSGIGA